MNKQLILGFRSSFWLGLIYSLLAMGVGLWVSSSVILTDGFFSLIGVSLTFLSLYVTRFVGQQDLENFPFGKETLMPLLVFVQYLIILLVSIFNIVSAVRALVEVEVVTESLTGLLFAIFALVYLAITYAIVAYFCKKSGNKPILRVEVEQWKFSILFSIGVAASFLLAVVLEQTSWRGIVPYIDPAMTIVITILFMITAIKEIRTAVHEILIGAPQDALREELTTIVQSEVEKCEHSDYLLRVGKIGEQLVVEVDIIIQPDSTMDSIRVQDELRERVYAKLSDCYKETLWLAITFVGHCKWAE